MGGVREGGPGQTLAPVSATVATEAWEPADHSVPEKVWPNERYEWLDMVGQGGMGEVWRVHDRLLQRAAVLKVVRRDRPSEAILRRLRVEAELTAGLQHPGVVPVHDLGVLEDGRPYYVMREVAGRTLADVVRELHLGSGPGGWGPEGGDAALRRVISAFVIVCQTVAYAHAKGVLHRDLKPDNIMLGEYGAVYVLDWGVAKRLGAIEVRADDGGPTDDGETGVGAVLGTPGFMAPEQAAGQIGVLDARSDVFSLGATLRQVLWGAASPRPAGPPVPDALASAAARAMSADPARRFPSADAFAGHLIAWLDGARRRAEALAQVVEADAHAARLVQLRAQVVTLRQQALGVLTDVPKHAPESRKLPGWRLEDRAAEREGQAAIVEQEWLGMLRAALQVDPELTEAHERLAVHYRARCEEAVGRRDAVAATRAEAGVRRHDRGAHRTWLAGQGGLTLRCDPPDVDVRVHRFVARDRRLVPEAAGPVLRGPLDAVSVPHGSLLLEITARGCLPLRVPVFVPRGGLWEERAPGGTSPQVHRLPRAGELSPDECLVPGGWYRTGGDLDAADPLPDGKVWVDAFVMTRFPITQGAWRAWLDALRAGGREADALERVPRAGVEGEGDGAEPAWRIGGGGRWESAAGEPLVDDLPISRVTWQDAVAYAAWRGQQDGYAWRLPHEVEWEKAARGADGRKLVWGDFFEPTWAATVDALATAPKVVPVSAFPDDVSVYGVRGLVGNVRDWCLNEYERAPSWVRGERLVPVPATGTRCAVRGGCANNTRSYCHPATRYAASPSARFGMVGLRLVRPW